MAQFVNIARAEVRPAEVDRYLAAFDQALRGIVGEQNCLSYTLSRSDAEPNVLWHYELYTSAEAFEIHRTLPHIVKFRDTITPMLVRPIVPQRCNVVAAMER